MRVEISKVCLQKESVPWPKKGRKEGRKEGVSCFKFCLQSRNETFIFNVLIVRMVGTGGIDLLKVIADNAFVEKLTTDELEMRFFLNHYFYG